MFGVRAPPQLLFFFFLLIFPFQFPHAALRTPRLFAESGKLHGSNMAESIPGRFPSGSYCFLILTLLLLFPEKYWSGNAKLLLTALRPLFYISCRPLSLFATALNSDLSFLVVSVASSRVSPILGRNGRVFKCSFLIQVPPPPPPPPGRPFFHRVVSTPLIFSRRSNHSSSSIASWR